MDKLAFIIFLLVSGWILLVSTEAFFLAFVIGAPLFLCLFYPCFGVLIVLILALIYLAIENKFTNNK